MSNDPTPTTNSTPDDRLWLALALRQSCSTMTLDENSWAHPSTEALRCLGLLYDVLDAMPPAYEGPAQQHINWALVVRMRAQHALITLPQDRTAPTRVPPARVSLGKRHRLTGDWLFDSFLLDQSWLTALRFDLSGALDNLGCEDARTTAATVRDIARCAQTYLTEAEFGDASDCLTFTVNDTTDPEN